VQPPEQAVVFSLRIATALFVEWDIEHGLMTVHRWAPRDGYSSIYLRIPTWSSRASGCCI
jgi:hypothetical protein